MDNSFSEICRFFRGCEILDIFRSLGVKNDLQNLYFQCLKKTWRTASFEPGSEEEENLPSEYSSTGPGMVPY